MAVTPRKVPQNLPQELKDDNRDVSDLWSEALKSYKGIVGFDLERKFDNVQAMIDFGGKEMSNFHKFRHNEKKVDKLRSLFATNLDYLEKGAMQLISAATPAFPPAAAIGTALTYVLSACRQVSADYDVVVVFFDDMNSFLQRIVILEARLPGHKAYQNCLMDVFTSFLNMCGFAHKYIELGRFKKWVSNLLGGEDGDLGGARKTMDKKLAHLQHATELAILGNTEEIKKMNMELKDNQAYHTQMLEEQRGTLDSIQDSTKAMQSDMAKLLKAFNEHKKEKAATRADKGQAVVAGQNKPPSANRIRNSLPDVDGELNEYYILKETMVPDTVSWLFLEPAWDKWLHPDDSLPPLLSINGESGTGKSHIAAAIYEKMVQVAAEDSSHHTCVAHFYFRTQLASLSTVLNSVVTVINQVAEQSTPLCEKLNAEYARDDATVNVWVWKDLVEHLLAPCFQRDFEYRLLLLLDGVDELFQHERERFVEFVKIIREKNLRISLVFTSRPSVLELFPESIKVPTIEPTKEKQVEDLEALVWHRLNTVDPLRKFSRYVKQRIKDRVVEVAPDMLYAEHMLRRFETIGREGAVLQDLSRSWPATMFDFYGEMLVDSYRRTPANRHALISTLFSWLTFPVIPLTLSQIVSLLRHVSGEPDFDLEELPDFIFSKFVSIGNPGVDVEASARLQAQGGWGTAVQDLEKGQDATNPEKVYDDEALPVKFKERSLRLYFFGFGEGRPAVRTRQSEANRQMYLTCVQICRAVAKNEPGPIIEPLWKYAAFCLLNHWWMIKAEEHSPEEMAEIMTELWAALTDQYGYMSLSEQSGIVWNIKLSRLFFDKISNWTITLNLVDKVRPLVDDTVATWWDEVAANPKHTMLGIAKGHIRNLYRASDVKEAQRSYESAQCALTLGDMEHLLTEQARKNAPDLVEEYSKDPDTLNANSGLLGVAHLFDDCVMDARAYRATAELLWSNEHVQPAELLCEKGLEICDEVLERYKTLNLLAQIQLNLEKADDAKQTIEQCLSIVYNEAIPPELKRAGLVTKARIEAGSEQGDAAIFSFERARALDPNGLTPGETLSEELDVHREQDSHKGVIVAVKKWSPLERLTWLTCDYVDSKSELVFTFMEAAAHTEEHDFMIEVFEDAIRHLDNVNAGAPLRCGYAWALVKVKQDLDAARKVLNDIFESNSTGWPYAVTDEQPDDTLNKAIAQAAELLFALFCKSRDPAAKKGLLESMKGLRHMPLAQDVPPQSDTFFMHYQTLTALMLKKLGPAAEFQTTLQKVIDISIDGLEDNVGWNDTLNLSILANALAHLSKAVPDGEKLWRLARIVFSASFSRLNTAAKIDINDDSEAEDKNEAGDAGENGAEDDGEAEEPLPDEGDLSKPDVVERSCDGPCDPNAEFVRWGGRRAYQCIICDFAFLCEPCYKLRIDANNGEPLRGMQFCGPDHEYLEGPIEGWQGIKDGRLTLASGESWMFDDLLKEIRTEVVVKAWDDFWDGA